MFAFVAYRLWGTAIETAIAQRALEDDFEALLADATPAPATTVAPTVDTDPAGGSATPAIDATSDANSAADGGDRAGSRDGNGAGGRRSRPATTAPAAVLPPVPQEGDPIARLEIPRIGVDDIVVEGVSLEDLKKGPGHYPDTPLPGQLGNAAIAGHRTTYGQPFYSIDEIEAGDEIVVTTLTGRYVYVVTEQQIVAPTDYEVVATRDPTVAALTLTSCHPRFTAQERIVVSSVLDPERSGPVSDRAAAGGRNGNRDRAAAADAPATADTVAADATGAAVEPASDASTAADDPADDGAAASSSAASAAETQIAEAFADGWFSDPGAPWQVALWGTALALVAIGAYLLSRSTRRDWVGALVGLVPFVIALYFFFQNVIRLLPPNL